jgi:hypothetical protein
MITQKLMSPVDINNSFTFSRPSVAFTPDGRLVQANNARYEAAKTGFGNAIRIEEGTTNLLSSVGTDPQFGTFTGWNTSQYAADGTASIVADPNSVTNGYVMQYVDTDGNTTTDTWDGVSSNNAGPFNPGDSCTITARWRVTNLTSGTVAVWSHWYGYDSNGVQQYDVPGDMTLTTMATSDTGWQVTYQTWTTPSATTYPLATTWKKYVRLGFDKTNLGATLSVDYIQVEKKVYPTTFTPTIRSDEYLSFNPSGVINLPQGTIEGMFYVDTKVHTTAAQWCMAFSTVTIQNSPYQEQNHFSLRKQSGSQQWAFYSSDASGNATTIPIGTFTTSGWHQFNVTWQTGVGINVYLDGALVRAANAADYLPAALNPLFYMCSWNNGGDQLDSLVTDFRFSNIVRTATEITNNYNSGAPLPVDANTTLKLNFNSPDAVRGAKSTLLGASSF